MFSLTSPRSRARFYARHQNYPAIVREVLTGRILLAAGLIIGSVALVNRPEARTRRD